MSTRVLRLDYPPSLLSQPILNKLIKRHEITVDIRQAHITLEEGWLEVLTTGEEEMIERAIA
ncbi:MAG: FeS-binding protein [Anaerolineales bacterium]|nr:MAG: FeS-binding protein [Anaerolineales bacterium]